MRVFVAIVFAVFVAGLVGAQFPHPRAQSAWRGAIVRDAAADEVEPPPAPVDAADETQRDAPIATMQVASASTEPAATSTPSPADAAASTPSPADAGEGGGGVHYSVENAVEALGNAVDKIAADAKQQAESAPPHPAEVQEETKDSVVALPTDVPPPLLLPVAGVKPDALHDTFTEARAGGTRPHDAIDIMATAGTPVVAADDGRIAKLFTSERGGLTVYQFDPSERFVYYYAHLESYAPGLVEGKVVHRGDAIGLVGSTGNANPAAPHLHFAVMVLGPEKHWWQASAINPYPLLIAPEGKLAGE
ncbi:MAG TPA: peptidoglycan DD-metalloendopeptidase family protein [Xanthomonadales bacterium]|nr:peptidoglycan DD-metalloendopeptidase family protein [Xanthomonadales bacterium]